MVRLLSNCFFFLLSGVIFAQSTIDVTILGDGKVTSSPPGIDCRGCNTGASLTYYVSDNGSDNNDGLTTNTPFQTFEYAFEKMKPGDNLEYIQGKKWYREMEIANIKLIIHILIIISAKHKTLYFTV